MLHDELDHLYRVFSRYGCPKYLEGCPCCTSVEESTALLRNPLRQLAAADLEHYAGKALTTWGVLEDYKYFLPRILELTINGDLLCDPEITLRKLSYGHIERWPPDEQRAVRDFVASCWSESVRAFDTYQADSILCGAARFMDDVTPLLEDAERISSDFRAAYRAEHGSPTKQKLTNSFWERALPSYQQVLSWVYAPDSTKKANKTDAGNGSDGICRAIDASRSPSSDP